MFGFFRKPKPIIANLVYNMLVEHARHPVFYKDYNAADSLDGRFDMIIIHMTLILRRYQAEKDMEMVNEIQNAFFKDMDRNLREMGIGDVSVPKKIKKMAEAYLGRTAAYNEPLNNNDKEALSEALAKNVEAVQDKALNSESLSLYCIEQEEYLNDISSNDLSKGNFTMLPPNATK